MNPTINSYRNWTFKSLLIAVYLLFFVAHLNGRFYSVANFYVYGKAQVGSVLHKPAVATPRQDRVHLSMDKRFHGQSAIQALSCPDEIELEAGFVILSVRYPVLSDASVDFSLDPRCLRGPPARTRC